MIAIGSLVERQRSIAIAMIALTFRSHGFGQIAFIARDGMPSGSIGSFAARELAIGPAALIRWSA